MQPEIVVDPAEEVGYKVRPPYIEDVSVEGPLRTTIPHALDTMEQLEAIEEDYNWWRYSKFAAPVLFLILILCAALFALTAFQSVGTLFQGLRDGRPRYYELQADLDSDTEAGQPKDNRKLRVAAVFCTFIPAIIALFCLYGKPRPNVRKAICGICAFILLVGAILAIIAFAVAENDRTSAVRCQELQFITFEACANREGLATATLAADFCLSMAALVACITLIYTGVVTGDFKVARHGWRQKERDQQQEPLKSNAQNIKGHKTHRTRLIFTCIALGFVLLFAIADAVFLTLLHKDHVPIRLRSFRGLTSEYNDNPPEVGFEHEGWTARNTRLRYALSAIGVITVLLNFMPWRSRVIAYLFAFVYFCLLVLACVVFALDIDEMIDSGDRGCPEIPYNALRSDVSSAVSARNTKLHCHIQPFVGTACVEFFLALLLLLYITVEFVVRWKSVHSQRKYPFTQIRKIEEEQDSRRAIRCFNTKQVMTAKEYYYHHRFLTGPEVVGPPGF